jgi:hypothetical protein
MDWLFWVVIALAAVCWVYMGIYVYVQLKEKYGKK